MSGKRRIYPEKPDRGSSLLAGIIFALSFGTALYGYLLRPPKPIENPPNILFETRGGPVLFAHRQHYDEKGAAAGCGDCHHNYDPEASIREEMSCRNCHYRDPETVKTVCAGDATHPRCIGRQCLNCHEGEECTFCHRTPK